MRFTCPPELTAVLGNGVKVGVTFRSTRVSLVQPVTELHIEQRAWVTVSCEEERPYEELLDVATRFSNFIALGVGHSIRFIEFTGTCLPQSQCGGAHKSLNIVIVQNRENVAKARSNTHMNDMIFTLSNIRDRFTEAVKSWFMQQEEFRPLYALYFGTLRGPEMYVELRFLNMFQALEAHHRRNHPAPVHKIQAHEETRTRILESINDKTDRKWLKNWLRKEYETTALDRLRDLVSAMDASWVIDDASLQLASVLRNYYTHFDSKHDQSLPEDAARPRIMHNLAVRLQILCELILLKRIGFSSGEARQRIDDTKRLQQQLI